MSNIPMTDTSKEEEKKEPKQPPAPRAPPGPRYYSKETFADQYAGITRQIQQRQQLDSQREAEKIKYKPTEYKVDSFNAPGVAAFLHKKAQPKTKNVYFFKQGRSWGVFVQG